MFYQEFANKYKEIQNNLLLFLDNDDNIEENYQNLINLFNHQEIKTLIYLISNISNNHYRPPNFYNKIKQLLQYLKEDIKRSFTYLKIFDIFKNNKAVLLILIELKILIIDQTVVNRMASKKYFARQYHQFFFPEIQHIIEKKYKFKNTNGENNESKQYKDNYYNIDNIENISDDFIEEKDSNVNDDEEENFNKDNEKLDNYKEEDFYETVIFQRFFIVYSKKLPENFFHLRKIGQNENYLCKLIREDMIDEFISYVNQHNYPLNSNIQTSIYETNSLLLKKTPTLIEYASFFGSTQIFKYLYLNNVKLTPILWIYGIHSDNPELISILEENHIQPRDVTYRKCFKEAVKCHHINVSNYIQNNYLDEKIISNDLKYNFKENILSYSFHYYNFSYFPKDLKNNFIFYYACKYDYYDIVKFCLETQKVNLSDTIKGVLFIYFFIMTQQYN